MIADTITKQIAEAMKARDDIRLSTLRLLSSALNYESIAKQHKLSDEEEMVVVRKEAKKRKDAIEALRQVLRPRAQGQVAQGSGREQEIEGRIKKEGAELAILEEFLPEQMSEADIGKIVDEVLTQTGVTSASDIGKVMGPVMAKIAGRADGGRVSELVRQKLTIE